MMTRLGALRAASRTSAFRVLGAVLAAWLFAYFYYVPYHTTLEGNGHYEATLARGDGYYQYANMLSLVFDRDLDLANQYAQFGDPFGLGAMRMPTGRSWIYPIGNSIAQMPAFLVAHAAAWVANLFGADIPMHGMTYFHMRITFLASLLAGFWALVLGYRLARRHVSETAALYGAAVVGLGTAVFYYGCYGPSYAHAWTALAVALLLEYWERTRGRIDARRWLALGACVGFAALTRLQEVTFAVIPAAEATVELVRRLRVRDLRGAARLLGSCALATVAALAVASPQLIANRIIMGDWLAVAPGAHYMRWNAPFLWEPLFSTRNGLFVWTPLAYLGALGLLAAPRGARSGAAALALGFALQVYVNGCAWSWWFDWSYSARRFVDVTVILVAGVAFVVERLRALHRRWPRLAPHAAVILVLAPLVLCNLQMSRWIATGKRRPGSVVQPATRIYGETATMTLDGVVDRVGDPFSWPHNLVWAARHGVEPARYDVLVGGELLGVDLRNYRVPGHHQEQVVRLDAGGVALYGAGGLTVVKAADGKRTTTWASDGARLLVPLFVTEDVHFVLRAAAPAPGVLTIAVNGDESTVTLSGGPEELRVDPGSGVLTTGTNEIEFRCAKVEGAPGCVALESLTLVYDVPRR
jgi:hypothetical protein